MVWLALIVQEGAIACTWGRQSTVPAAIVLLGFVATDSRSTTGTGRLFLRVPKKSALDALTACRTPGDVSTIQ